MTSPAKYSPDYGLPEAHPLKAPAVHRNNQRLPVTQSLRYHNFYLFFVVLLLTRLCSLHPTGNQATSPVHGWYISQSFTH